jgi:gamma-glutamylcyclotransferase (GGCT)/AIG2-like uncharacterized protein YtfP
MAAKALFVYGTLRRGLPSNSLLAGQQFLGEARSLPHYRLYDAGPYPCLVEDPQQGVAVRGEVWRVDEATLARLDEYEGVPHLFVRREIDLESIAGPVFAYFYRGDISGLKDCGESWPKLP